ncbi:MAG: hypothetical protein M1834_006415 [Cirrosporium novae-zelandiae]|nr:MAG: hypothetical protein M1834_006415 [Cirrosporium novae-zelandiae]
MATITNTNPNSPAEAKHAQARDPDLEQASTDNESIGKGDILSLEHIDPALNAKMHVVNDAIDEIGWTTWQLKLFFLNGFGYAVDSLIILVQSIIATQAAYEFNPSYDKGLTIAVYVGMLVGALFWGFTADIIGRKFAFNVSLMICSIFAIVAGASPNWFVLGLFTCLSAFGAGGNLVLDTAVFLEYLPSRFQWMVTLLAAWWGIGQLIAGLFAWALLPNYSCESVETCTYDNNKGWRYVWYSCGGLVFVMSILRITVIRLKETPKFLLGEGKDEAVVETLQHVARKYNRHCSITLETLSACGVTQGVGHAKKRFSLTSVWVHIKGLYQTKKMGRSTSLIWLSWLLIGLAYPLFNVFLPSYLASRGADFGQISPNVTWRNYALANFASIWGPVLAAFLCTTRIGRRGTMVVGALLSMAFFFAYTQVRTQTQNIAFTCIVDFTLNIYYGTLYAFTPEVLPSAHRGTGNGIAIGLNRVMGIVSAVIASAADTATSAPIYICAALYIVMAIVAMAFPFEPHGHRSS